MAAASKRGADNDDDLFSYSNTIELTFAKKPRDVVSLQKHNVDHDDSSSSSDSDEPCYGWKQNEIISDDEDVSSGEKDELIVVNDDDVYSKDTPSPGPPKLDKASGAVSKKTTASMRALNKLKKVLTEEALSPVVARSNVDDPILIDDSPDSRVMTIKIKCHGIVKRYKIAQNEPFANLINSIAKKEGTSGDKVMLYLGEKSIRQDDTPFTIQCSITDIFECVIVSKAYTDGDDERGGKVNIKIQTKESHSKEDYHICKMSPLEDIVKQYCQGKNIKFDRVKIFFDGEELSLNDTPEGLDMEDGDVIDLKYG